MQLLVLLTFFSIYTLLDEIHVDLTILIVNKMEYSMEKSSK